MRITTIFILFTQLMISQVISFKDQDFKKILLERHSILDTNKNGEIEFTEAEKFTQINLSHSNVSNIDDIKNFKNLKFINIPNCNLKKVHLDGLKSLENVNISNNQIIEISIKNCPKLKSLKCDFNKINYLDVSNLNLENLWCSDNLLKKLILTNCKKLRWLYCYNNNLSEINLSGLENLFDFRCENNNIKTIDIRDCRVIEFVYCSKNPFLKSLKLKNGIRPGYCYFVQFENCPLLKKIYVDKEDLEIKEVKTKIEKYNRKDIQIFI